MTIWEHCCSIYWVLAMLESKTNLFLSRSERYACKEGSNTSSSWNTVEDVFTMHHEEQWNNVLNHVSWNWPHSWEAWTIRPTTKSISINNIFGKDFLLPHMITAWNQSIGTSAGPFWWVNVWQQSRIIDPEDCKFSDDVSGIRALSADISTVPDYLRFQRSPLSP